MYGDQTEFFLQNCGYVVRVIPTESPINACVCSAVN